MATTLWLLAIVAPRMLAAQGVRAQDTATVLCAGQRITDVVVRTSAPTTAVLRRVPVMANVVAAVHTTTNPDLVRRFMLLGPGDNCDELRRAESERLLRAQPFIAEASIRTVQNRDGSVFLDVRTSDEVALVFDVAIGQGKPPLRAIRVGDANLSGEGIYLAGDWRDGWPFRNGYGVRYVDNQLLGRPYLFTVDTHQNPLGDNWLVDFMHPFYTDIQRIAWRAQAGGRDDYVQFMNDINSSHAITIDRNYFDVGGIVRVGPPGHLSLFGASVSGDDERPGSRQELVTAKGFAPDTSTVLLNRYVPHRIARINTILGIRDIGFARVRGFDALTATQDLPVGFQLGSLIGKSASLLGSRDNDVFMAGDAYLGAVGPTSAFRFQAYGEGRYDNANSDWDGLLTAARAVGYLKFTPINTTTLSLEFSGGWRQRIPFNLTLSDAEGGVRGYSSSSTPGGQRFVARLDDRLFVARPYGIGDLGLGAFVEGGRLWAGDVPYGVNTPFRSSVGISLLGSAPVASARLWRMDLAFALTPEPGGHRVELRFSNTNKTTFFLAEPGDIRATRESTVPASVFRWPQ
jgi:hypothetical protein